MKAHDIFNFKPKGYWPIRVSQELRRILKSAREQGKLKELCALTGISMRSIQRWLPTPLKTLKKTIRPSRTTFKLLGLPDPNRYVEIRKRRKNAKQKALDTSLNFERLLVIVLLEGHSFPDEVPTNEEILQRLNQHKNKLGSWIKVSQSIDISMMTLYRFRKTHRLSKSYRLLLHYLLSDDDSSLKDVKADTECPL